MLKRKSEDEKFLENSVKSELDNQFGAHYLRDCGKPKFVIKRWDGKIVKLRSGKSVWGGKGAASNALSHHICVPDHLKSHFKSSIELKYYLLKKGHIIITEVK